MINCLSLDEKVFAEIGLFLNMKKGPAPGGRKVMYFLAATTGQ